MEMMSRDNNAGAKNPSNQNGRVSVPEFARADNLEVETAQMLA